MNNAFTFLNQAGKAKWETPLNIALFILLWTYLWIRANTVFYASDELVSKWGYMISWNPFPYQGFLSGNNHFLHSFLGGLFIRLFQSDDILVVRLASLLSFPLYFWSIAGLRKFFQETVNFYLLLITLSCTAFVLEYFGLARGYGISLALLVFALQQTLLFFIHGKAMHFLLSALAWVLSVYANLTLLPVALAGLIYLAIFLWRERNTKWLSVIVLALLPMGYIIKYAFYLKQAGELNFGGQEGFVSDTVHSIVPYLWNANHFSVDAILIVASLSIALTMILILIRTRNPFNIHIVFPLFFVLAVGSIVLQHWILGVDFPLNRGAIYLVVLFFSGLSFTLDHWKNKWMGYPVILLTLFFFGLHFNFKISIYYYYEHYDEALLTNIKDEVYGIPPSTGGRNHRLDHAVSREKELPLRAFQLAKYPSDTLVDYIVTYEKARPDAKNLYHVLHQDKISGLTLYERNSFLSRKKADERFVPIGGNDEYFGIYLEKLDRPLFFRCSGFLEDMTIYKETFLVFTAENGDSRQPSYYHAVSFNECSVIPEDGKVSFDFTFAVNTYAEADQVKVYLWNKESQKQQGEIKLEVYEIR